MTRIDVQDDEEHHLVAQIRKLIKTLKKDKDMDTTSLEAELNNALTAVQSALTAVQAAPATPAPVDDPVWDAVKADLVTGGWTAPVAPEEPAPTA